MRNLHLLFVLCTASQIISGNFAKFCGLLRIYELYNFFLRIFTFQEMWRNVIVQVHPWIYLFEELIRMRYYFKFPFGHSFMKISCDSLIVALSYPVLAFKYSKFSPLKYLSLLKLLSIQPILSIYSNDEATANFQICKPR